VNPVGTDQNLSCLLCHCSAVCSVDVPQSNLTYFHHDTAFDLTGVLIPFHMSKPSPCLFFVHQTETVIVSFLLLVLQEGLLFFFPTNMAS